LASLTGIDQTLPESNCKIPTSQDSVAVPLSYSTTPFTPVWEALEHLRRHGTQVPEKLKIDSGLRIVSAVGSMSSHRAEDISHHRFG